MYSCDDASTKTAYTRQWREIPKVDVACLVAREIPVACSANKLVVLSASNILKEDFSNLTTLTGQNPSGTSVHILPTDRISPAGITK